MSGICTDAFGGAPHFTLDVRKVEGGYEAKSLGTTVPASVGPTEADAIQRHTLACYEAIAKGTIFLTDGKV